MRRKMVFWRWNFFLFFFCISTESFSHWVFVLEILVERIFRLLALTNIMSSTSTITTSYLKIIFRIFRIVFICFYPCLLKPLTNFSSFLLLLQSQFIHIFTRYNIRIHISKQLKSISRRTRLWNLLLLPSMKYDGNVSQKWWYRVIWYTPFFLKP